ncbi:MAG: hypothetical protein AAF393_17060 [Pseudomonadota bacterium]
MRAVAFAALVLAVGGCQPPTPRMSLAEAKALCTQRATAYARTPRPVPGETGNIEVGLLAELPDSFMVRDFYRSCVYANAGVRPDTMPDIPIFG